MCGRYNITDDPYLQALLDSLGVPLNLPVHYNISPTDFVPMVINTEGGNQLVTARWWLVPSWSDGPSSDYAMFNARAENLHKSRAFRKPFESQRCILPASSFIEWHQEESGKQAYEITPVDSAIAFAGLWDYWEGQGRQLYSCSIVTSAATEGFRRYHKRMPVMLEGNEIEAWLDPQSRQDELQTLLVPSLRARLGVQPVDKAIGNSRLKEKPEPVGDVEFIERQ